MKTNTQLKNTFTTKIKNTATKAEQSITEAGVLADGRTGVRHREAWEGGSWGWWGGQNLLLLLLLRLMR